MISQDIKMLPVACCLRFWVQVKNGKARLSSNHRPIPSSISTTKAILKPHRVCPKSSKTYGISCKNIYVNRQIVESKWAMASLCNKLEAMAPKRGPVEWRNGTWHQVPGGLFGLHSHGHMGFLINHQQLWQGHVLWGTPNLHILIYLIRHGYVHTKPAMLGERIYQTLARYFLDTNIFVKIFQWVGRHLTQWFFDAWFFFW